MAVSRYCTGRKSVKFRVWDLWDTPDHPLTTVLLGTNYLIKNMYQLSPVQDFELAKTLMRVAPSVTRNLIGTRSLTEEGYGSVRRVYVVSQEDKTLTEEFQRWMIKNYPVKEVMEINDADHMPMFSKPLELCDRLLTIADKIRMK